jgi:hypothetical protein
LVSCWERYDSEKPERHSVMRAMWPDAKRDVAKRRRWKLAELRANYPDKMPKNMAA